MTARPRCIFAVALALLAAAARADDEPGADRPLEDPAVERAQFERPAPRPPAVIPASPAAPSDESAIAAVIDPATPLVRLHLRVPPHVAPGKDVAYKLFVDNPTQGDAHKVAVRMPVPKGTTAGDCDPDPNQVTQGPDGALFWDLGTLRAGERRLIEVKLKPGPQVGEIAARAYVTFQHGQVVTTKIDRPKLEVKKGAPKQAVGTDAIPVAVEVVNNGKVPVHDVKLVEDVSAGFEFAPDADAEEGATKQQRIWKLGTLRAGERRRVDYRLTAKGAGELMAQSAVYSSDVPEAVIEKAGTKVLMPAMELELLGPPKVAPGDGGDYTAVVKNTGTLPLPEVIIAVTLPEECSVSKMTNGGQRTGDAISWRGPLPRTGGPLKPGEKFEVRFRLKASTGGRRTVSAEATASRGLSQSKECATQFEGAAQLQWQAELDPPTVAAGQSGRMNVRVRNSGSDAAKGTRLTVEIPQGIRVSDATPMRFKQSAGMLSFDEVTIPAGESRLYTLTYQPAQAGMNWFKLQLSADVLNNQPLTKEQEVSVTNGRTTSRGRERE